MGLGDLCYPTARLGIMGIVAVAALFVWLVLVALPLIALLLGRPDQ